MTQFCFQRDNNVIKLKKLQLLYETEGVTKIMKDKLITTTAKSCFLCEQLDYYCITYSLIK